MIDAKTGPPPMDPNKTYVNPGEEDQMVCSDFIFDSSIA
jgi:hypothetical protein